MRMKPIFLFLALISSLMMAYTFSVGWRLHYGREDFARRRAAGEQIADAEQHAVNGLIVPHFIWSMMTGIVVCLTHSVVLTYFLGTGKAIQEQTELQNWDETYNTARRKLMGKAVIPASLGIVFICAAAFSGGFAMIQKLPGWAHLAVVILSFAAQGGIFLRELAIIHENGKLMDQIIDRLGGDENIRLTL
ncbi:hypothetical protein HY256_05665 [Candidatus Sumerlaeota bacterium]|nr:hypothetical protein [Candidatus Sumerlaeota bacterium]